MPELGSYGSVRGVLSNGHSYRDRNRRVIDLIGDTVRAQKQEIAMVQEEAIRCYGRHMVWRAECPQQDVLVGVAFCLFRSDQTISEHFVDQGVIFRQLPKLLLTQ